MKFEVEKTTGIDGTNNNRNMEAMEGVVGRKKR